MLNICLLRIIIDKDTFNSFLNINENIFNFIII